MVLKAFNVKPGNGWDHLVGLASLRSDGRWHCAIYVAGSVSVAKEEICGLESDARLWLRDAAPCAVRVVRKG